MDFLNFGLLPYFLPLAAIPLVLHLFTLYRVKTVELSTFRFLFDSYVQQRRRMKFLEALIALLRTLFLLFLIAAVARPVVKHWDSLFGGRGGARDVVMLIDTSASMSATTDGVPAIERAKRAALAVVDRLGAEDRVTVLRVAGRTEELCSRYSADAEAIQSQIEHLRVSPSRANLFAAFSQVFGAQARELSQPRVYLFSDLQTSGWSEFQEGPGEDLIPEGTELIVVDVGAQQPAVNLALVGEAPRPQPAIVGLPLTFRPEVANHGTEPQEVTVSVHLDDKEIARRTLTLKAGETAPADVLYTPTQPGVFRGRYEIASDYFPADDRFLFSLTVTPQVHVLIVNGHPVPDPLENEALYLRTAMTATEGEHPSLPAAPAPPAGATTPATPVPLEAQKAFVRALEIQEIPEPSLTVELLSRADVVVLANCGSLRAPDQYKWVAEFVAKGGGLLILPGDKVNPALYNQHLLPAPGVADGPLVAVTLAPPEGDPAKAETFARFGAIDYGHPLLSVFGEGSERYLTKVSAYRRFPLQLPEPRGNGWPLIEFADSKPAIVESRFGTGRVLLCAFPFHSRWGNLPMKPEFVPLVLRMIAHVKRDAEAQGPAVVAAESSAEFMVATTWAPASAKVTDVAGRVTPVTFERSNSRLVGAFTGTYEQGFYTVDVSGGRSEQPKHETLAFAVNLAPGESDPERLTRAQLENLFPSAKLRVVDASAEAQQLYGSVGNEREVWRPLILLTFIIIGIEFLLSTLGGHSASRDDASPSWTELAKGKWIGNLTGVTLPEMAETGGRD